MIKEIPHQAAGELAILETAERLFSEQGYERVSMRSVAQAAGVSKSNIYHHFDSKEDLYLAVIRSSVANTVALVDELESHAGSLEERLKSFAQAHLNHILEKELTSRLILREALSGDERRSREFADKDLGDVYRRMIAIMRDGQCSGVLRPDIDPALCAFLLMSANVFFFQSRDMLKQFPEVDFAQDPNRYSSGMADVLLNGMLCEPAPRGGQHDA